MEGNGRLLAGWLIDGRGGPVQRDRVIRFRHGRIVALGAARREGPADEPVLDYSRATVLPALIDAHVHLALSGTTEPAARQHQLHAPTAVLASQVTRHVEAHLASGILAVRDAGDRLGVALQGARRHPGPVTVRAAGAAWYRRQRYGGFVGCDVTDGAALVAAVEQQCRLESARRPDQVKILQSGLNSLRVFGRPARPQFSLDELAPAVAAAAAAGLGAMVHANGRQAVAIALAAGARSLEHGFFMGPANLERLAELGAAWVPTAVTMQAWVEAGLASVAESDVARRTLDHQLAQIGRARALGVRLVAGTDSGSPGVEHGRSLRSELALFMAAGCSLTRAVRCAAEEAAALLGLVDMGCITPGRRAHLVVVPGPPQELPESLGRIACLVVDGEPRRLPANGGGERRGCDGP
jgi:imidazolonepropionase-like amidohydrolase